MARLRVERVGGQRGVRERADGRSNHEAADSRHEARGLSRRRRLSPVAKRQPRTVLSESRRNGDGCRYVSRTDSAHPRSSFARGALKPSGTRPRTASDFSWPSRRPRSRHLRSSSTGGRRLDRGRVGPGRTVGGSALKLFPDRAEIAIQPVQRLSNHFEATEEIIPQK